MERVAGQSHRISALGMALAPREPVISEDDAHRISVVQPDPEVLAREERARVLQAAHEEGMASGLAEADARIAQRVEECERQIREAHRAAQERVEGGQRQLERLLKTIPDRIAEQEQQIERVAAEIAFEALVRCLGVRNTDRGLTLQVVEQVLHERRQRPATLWISAEDAESLKSFADIEGLKISADPHLARGDIRLETPVGQYETGIVQRIQALSDAFIQTLGEDS
ncbi:FliH/SctL family protein [Solilutibacter silvestris]|uniref:FliH/SctL family protein n=1 Tax=Solilutibacter silvestris TaxID=1645665 RepID=UPI003D32E35C